MSVTFRSESTPLTLHLCNGEARKLLAVLGIDTSIELCGSLKPKELIRSIEEADASTPNSDPSAVNWDEDPNIDDMGEGLRRLAVIAKESGDAPVNYS